MVLFSLLVSLSDAGKVTYASTNQD